MSGEGVDESVEEMPPPPYCPCGWSCHQSGSSSPCSFGCIEHDPRVLTARAEFFQAQNEALRMALVWAADKGRAFSHDPARRNCWCPSCECQRMLDRFPAAAVSSSETDNER